MAKEIVIIGAGPAGLTAAYELLKHTDCKPVILEESIYIGGISRTHDYHGNRMDLGGHRFFTKSKPVMDIWNELMPMQSAPAKDDLILCRAPQLDPQGEDPEKTERVMLRRRRISRIYFLRKFFDYPVSLKPQTFLNMGLRRTLAAGFGYMRAVLFKREEQSLEDFYINCFGRPLYEMFFEDYTEKLWGIHPSKIAPDWGAQRVKGLSLWKVVCSVFQKPFRKNGPVETSLIEEFYYPKRGPGQLWEIMAEEIISKGGTILLDSRVNVLRTEGDTVTGVEYTDASGKSHLQTADAVFSSMPIRDLVAAMGTSVPPAVGQIAHDLPYRDFITVGLYLKKLKLKNNSKIPTVSGIVPDCWIYVQERNVKLGRLQIFNNWSPYMVNDFENNVWMSLEYFCTEGDMLWEMDDHEFIRFATKELESIGIIDASDVLDSVRVRVKKAYPAYFGSYAQFQTVRDFLNGYNNLYCIGRNGQHRYNNMDHSMLTAIEAVNAFSLGKDKRFIWEINTEEEYHETDNKS